MALVTYGLATDVDIGVGNQGESARVGGRASERAQVRARGKRRYGSAETSRAWRA